MTETMEHEIRRITSGYNRRRNQIEYNCGCKYMFDHHITLEDVCPEHERQLVTLHG